MINLKTYQAQYHQLDLRYAPYDYSEWPVYAFEAKDDAEAELLAKTFGELKQKKDKLDEFRLYNLREIRYVELNARKQEESPADIEKRIEEAGFQHMMNH